MQSEVLSFDDVEVLDFQKKKFSKRKLSKSTDEKVQALRKKTLFDSAKKSIKALNSENSIIQGKIDDVESWEDTLSLKDSFAIDREILGISKEEARIQIKKQYDVYKDLLVEINALAQTDKEKEICSKLEKSLFEYLDHHKVDMATEVDKEHIDDSFEERAKGVQAVDNLLYRRFSEGDNIKNRTIIMKLLSMPYRDRLFVYGAIEHGRTKSVSLQDIMDYSVGYIPDGNKIIDKLSHARILDLFRTRDLKVDPISSAMRLCNARKDDIAFISKIDKDSWQLDVKKKDITEEEHERNAAVMERAGCFLNCVSNMSMITKMLDEYNNSHMDSDERKALEKKIIILMDNYERDVAKLLILNDKIPESVTTDVDKSGKWTIPDRVYEYIRKEKVVANKDEFNELAKDLSIFDKGAKILGNVILAFLLITPTKDYIKNFSNSTKADRASKGVDLANSYVKTAKMGVSTANSAVTTLSTWFTSSTTAIQSVTKTVTMATTGVSLVTGSVVAGIGAFEVGETYFKRDKKRAVAEDAMNANGLRNDKLLKLSERMSSRRKISGYSKIVAGALTVSAGIFTLSGLVPVGSVLGNLAIAASLGGAVIIFVKGKKDRTAAVDDYLEIDRHIKHKYAEIKQVYHRELTKKENEKYRDQLRRHMMQSRGYTSIDSFYKVIIEEYAERMWEELFCGDAGREKIYSDLARSMGIHVDKEKGYPSYELLVKKMME